MEMSGQVHAPVTLPLKKVSPHNTYLTGGWVGFRLKDITPNKTL